MMEANDMYKSKVLLWHAATIPVKSALKKIKSVSYITVDFKHSYSRKMEAVSLMNVFK